MRVSEKISVNIKNVVVVFVAYRSIFVVLGMQKRLRPICTNIQTYCAGNRKSCGFFIENSNKSLYRPIL